jgi:hypothetical protein
MEKPRRDFLRTISSAVALPALAPILKPVGKSRAAETSSGAWQDTRVQFPLLGESVNGHPLAYLDSAATTQRPKAVLDALTNFYLHDNANPAKALHQLARRSTGFYEEARASVARLLTKCARARGDRFHARNDGSDQPGRFVVGQRQPK